MSGRSTAASRPAPRRPSLLPRTVVRPDEWFTLRVVARGNRFTLFVNGSKVASVVDRDNRFRSGTFALKHRPLATVRFRKIEVRELPPEH